MRSATLLILLSLLFNACAPTAVRVPEGTNEADLATVYFYSAKGIDTSYLAVDGVGQGVFAMGLKVLPGEHEAGCDYRIESEKCYWDSYCIETLFYGKCRATFRAQAGREYSVKLTQASDSVYVSVVDAENSEVAGSGSCETTRTAPATTRADIKLH